MKTTGHLEHFIVSASVRTKVALAAAGVMATLVGAVSAPAHAHTLEP